MPWSYLEIKQPTWALFAFVRSHAGYNTDKRREETKTAVKLVPSYDVLNTEDKGNPQETAVHKPEKEALPAVLLTAVWFWSCSAIKTCFLWHIPQNPFPFPPDLYITMGNLGIRWELRTDLSSGWQASPWERDEQKDNETMQSHPEASCPKSVNELLKDWHSFKITQKPRQQFHNISESKQKCI